MSKSTEARERHEAVKKAARTSKRPKSRTTRRNLSSSRMSERPEKSAQRQRRKGPPR